MDDCSLDPYEEQLLKVFDSHDHDSVGSLDTAGLRRLCETLQLAEKSDHLINALALNSGQNGRTRATFAQFKDALLQLLGTMSDSSTTADADREVAPKYVVGGKKYGRRSRPRIDDSAPSSLQRSHSTTEHMRRPLRLQRCTSVPSVPSCDDTGYLSDVGSEEMLRAAWRKLGVGEDGHLNQNELTVVCEAIGLNKLADSVIRHLSSSKAVLDLEYDYKISFRELLEALRKDDTWSFLGSDCSAASKESFIVEPDDCNEHHIRLGPDGSGYVSRAHLLDMWDAAGIAAPAQLFADLGFKATASAVDVRDLAGVLDKEIGSLGEQRVDHTCSPLVALLHADRGVHRAEIKCLRALVQQVCDEKEKLRFDVSEANSRATLLAQEIDESVLKMEQKARAQHKALELRHVEATRDLTAQFAADREQMLAARQQLAARIKLLEGEEAAVRKALLSARALLGAVEDENRELVRKVGELEAAQVGLEQHIDALEVDKAKALEAEVAKSDLLLVEVGLLQRDNCTLRDRNDEMACQIEALHRQVQSLSSVRKCSDSDERVDDCWMGGVGGKRRNQQEASVDELDFESAITGSPRLGKMRKFHESKDAEDANDTSLTLSELDNDDEEDVDETQRRRRKMLAVEHLLCKYAIPLEESNAPSEDSKQINPKKDYTCMLEHLLAHLLTKVSDADADATDFHNENELNDLTTESLLNNNCNNCSAKLDELRDDNTKLTEKCDDLQNGLSLLRDEYEMCEDYWQKKLEDERSIYELEQAQSSDKLNEVLTRLTEYEEQFLDESRRLATIEESAHLEKQYTDLEAEYDEYKERTLVELTEKTSLISVLGEQLGELAARASLRHDASVQVTEKSWTSLSSHLIETTNLYSHDTEAKSPQRVLSISPFTLPSAAQYADNGRPAAMPSVMPLKSKKNRRHVRSLTQPTRNPRHAHTASDSDSDSPVCNGRRDAQLQTRKVQELQESNAFLQQKLQELYMEIKYHKQHYEQLSKSYCRLYSSCFKEISDTRVALDQQTRCNGKLHEKLAANDMLVGKLYIENAYLLKTNQRLEQQIDMFANPHVF